MPKTNKAVQIHNEDRAAILLMSLGEEIAADVLRLMGPKQVQKIGIAMANMGDMVMTKDMVEGVYNDFMRSVQGQTSLGMGADEYVRSVLIKSLGEDKAAGVIDRILLGGNAQGLESLKWMNAKAVAELIQNEHPQIIAIVLSYLDGDQSADILTFFPEKLRADLVLRVATLESVQPDAMKELNDTLERQLKGGSGVGSSSIGGIKRAANILNFIESSIESGIMDKIKEVDEDLGQEIQDLMFVFENMIDIDDRGIQAILREISTDVLLLALKAAEEDLKEKIFKNMSKRASEMLRDDLEAKGPVRLSEVE
ncbi:MAG: flagellar motor switch protein FliG, partial [Gammaproteobacteria bacterium]